MKTRMLALMVTALMGNSQPALPTVADEPLDWQFKVYLDDDPVGVHRFKLDAGEAARKVRSEARFTVRFLTIKAYAYEHEAEETWRGDCLTTLKARTDDNGQQSTVIGQERGGRFELRKGSVAEQLTGCIMTFAYWNPLMLKQSRLLNPQSGDYIPVKIEARGREQVPVKGLPVSAERYHLDAGKFQIDLWYADGGRWVALDSLLDSGHTLRYRIE